MHRTTILLPKELMRDAEEEARQLGISFSELVRRRLRQGGVAEGKPATQSRFFRRKPWTGPGPSDVAERHDEYLYGR